MKKIFTILTAVLITATVWAQSPEKMTYQSVIRNASDQLVTNQGMGMQISILQGSANGTAVYVETHSTTSNANGLVTIEIGNGATSDDFSSIDWENGPYFLKSETDPGTSGGTNYTITGTSQLLSVPYALYAKTAGTADYNNLTNLPALNIANWDNAYNWGDHSTAGYLTSFTETDPIYTANFDLSSIATDDLLKYDGSKFVKFTPNYLTSYTETDPVYTANFDLSSVATDDLLKYDGSKFVKFTPNYLTSYTETDPVYTAWDKNYADLTNKPTAISDFTMNANNTNITNIADPTDTQDAATKAYVDALEAQVKIMQNSLIAEGLMVKDYDGNVYGAVKIGNQIWMAENLKVTHYPDGTPIPLVTDNTAWGNLGNNNTDDAYCFYNNDANSEYGALYTWAAAMGDNAVSSNTNPSGVQGVCPAGWHLPSDAELTELADYLGGTSIAGGKLKETGTTHWNSPNTGATNESGFSALPGGYRNSNSGSFNAQNFYGYLWSTTEDVATIVWYRYLTYNNSNVYRNDDYKSLGFSVRCLRD